jgi:three-Cys-motif partner protein
MGMTTLPDDGLPIDDVGEWTLDKHERLRKYIDITRAARRKYVNGPSRTSTYIDPFCGMGRARVRESGDVILGSPVLAYSVAKDGGVPFTDVYLGDLRPEAGRTSETRIERLGGTARIYVGRAEDTCREIVDQLNPYGLHFAFLDPYDLGGLSLEAIRQLARVKRIDLLVHVSVMDLQRNLNNYAAVAGSPLDAFAPGWREHVSQGQSTTSFRTALLQYWIKKVQELGFAAPRGMELVTGSKNQRLYWLAFFSRSEIAADLWEKIRHISGQGNLL